MPDSVGVHVNDTDLDWDEYDREGATFRRKELSTAADADEHLQYRMVSTMCEPDLTVYSHSETMGVFSGAPPGGATSGTSTGSTTSRTISRSGAQSPTLPRTRRRRIARDNSQTAAL